MKSDVPLKQSKNIIDLCLYQLSQRIGVYSSLPNTKKNKKSQNRTTCGIKMKFWPSYQNFLANIFKSRLHFSVALFELRQILQTKPLTF